MKWTRLVITGILLVSVAGCQFKPVKKGGDEADTSVEQQQQQDQRHGADVDTGFDIKQLNDPSSPLSQRVIYFDLDSSSLSEADRELVAAHARFLAANPNIAVVLEGHADERGSREYNIALGERRAKAVKQLMSLQGVSQSQAQVISFGEERPVALNHDEESWRLNRRVEILYSGY